MFQLPLKPFEVVFSGGKHHVDVVVENNHIPHPEVNKIPHPFFTETVPASFEQSIVGLERERKEAEERRALVNHSISKLEGLVVDDTDLFTEYRNKIQDLLWNDENDLKSGLPALVSFLVLEETNIKIALSSVNRKAPCSSVFVSAPRMYRCTNRRSSVAEPEICFRIIHIALDASADAIVAAYREQAVEIVLGPKVAFVNGNVGTVTREVATDYVVSAVPPHRRKPTPYRKPETPRVVEFLRKAIKWQSLLESGKVINKAEISRREGISRARVTQIMGMLCLAPEIQGLILSNPETVHQQGITERALRPIARLPDRSQQCVTFRELLKENES